MSDDDGDDDGKGKWGQREEGVNAGRCLFKTRTQHHKMVGKNCGVFFLHNARV